MHTPEKNRDELLSLMKENGLKAEDLPALTDYSASTVAAWMMSDRTSARARQVPDRALNMFKLKLEAAKAELNK